VAVMPRSDDNNELAPAEQARLRHRDRKRETRMVVDNAGMKRVLPAVAQRRRRDAPGPSKPDTAKR